MSRPKLILIILAAIVVGVAGLGYAYSLLDPIRKYEDAARDLASGGGKHALNEFALDASAPEIQSQADREAITKTLEGMQGAMATGDGDGFVAAMHIPRLTAQVFACPGAPSLPSVRGRTQFIEGVRTGLGETPRQAAAAGTVWEDLRMVRVGLDAELGEALAYTKVRIGFVWLKIRFWLIHDEAEWKVFDFESIDDGMRVSNSMALLAAAALDGGSKSKVQKLKSAQLKFVEMSGSVVSGDFDVALGTGEAIRALRPPKFLLQQVDTLTISALAGLGRHEESLAMIDTALQNASASPMLYYLRAENLIFTEAYPEAIEAAEKYLSIVGDDPDGFLQVGASYEQLGKLDEAEAAYRKGMATGVPSPDNEFNLGTVLLSLGRVEEAEAVFDDAVVHAPDCGFDALTYFVDAASRLHGERQFGSVVKFAQSQLARGEMADAYYFLGLAQRQLGQAEDAAVALEKGMGLDLESEKPAYWMDLAFALSAMGQGEKADEYAALVADEFPSEVAFLAAGRACAGDDVDGAAALVVKLLESEPDRAGQVMDDVAFASVVEHASVAPLLR